MINLLEWINLKWTTRNKAWYQEKGYEYTSMGDEFWVHAGDLPGNSNEKITAWCDCPQCSSAPIKTPYRNYNRIIEQNGMYRCKNCTIINNHTQSIINSGKREKYYQMFLDKCEEHNCVPLTTFDEFDTTIDARYICPIHGETSTNVGRMIWNNAWCYKCGKIHMSEKTRLTPEQVKEIVESKNGNILLNPEEYINSTTRNLRIICGSCHHEFTTTLSAIYSGDGRCSDCGCRVAGDLQRTTKEQLIEMATIDGELMVINPDDYVDMRTPLWFKCSECGEPFQATPYNYLKRGFSRCSQCKLYSYGEVIIANVLKKYDVIFVPQKRYDDCKDKRTLPFDFYLPEYNCLIEFQGKQHYEPIEYFGGQKQLEYIQKHDKMKKEYAEKHNIGLLIIDYYEQDNIEEILVTTFNLEQF